MKLHEMEKKVMQANNSKVNNLAMAHPFFRHNNVIFPRSFFLSLPLSNKCERKKFFQIKMDVGMVLSHELQSP